jgi:hypothetical protein
MNVKTELIRVTDALDEAHIDYAVCGGLALAIHGFPRATKDVDLIVSAEDLAAVRTAVRPLGFRLETGIITFRAGTDEEMKLWRVSRAVDDILFTVDFMLATRFLEDVWQNRKRFEFAGKQISVVSVEGLRKMKQFAGRPQDLADLDKLNNSDV